MDRDDNIVVVGTEDENPEKNNDGLTDELTKLICQGIVGTSTGVRVFDDAKDGETWEDVYNRIMENDDYDGDGLKNGEEIVAYFDGDTRFIRILSYPDDTTSATPYPARSR